MTDQTSFMPLASGPQQPAYWQAPTPPAPASEGWGQPGGLWTSRPVPPVQGGPLSVPPATLDTGGRRPPESPERRIRVVLIVLLITMIAAAGTFGALYMSASSATETAQAQARAESDARQKAVGEAKDRVTTVEGERDEAKAAVQDLQACQQASRDMLTALGGDEDDPATLDAVNAAIRRMADTCV